MALTTDRISVLRGRPPMRAGGRRGFRTAHCWLVRSLGYGFGFIPFLRSRPLFGTDSERRGDRGDLIAPGQNFPKFLAGIFEEAQAQGDRDPPQFVIDRFLAGRQRALLFGSLEACSATPLVQNQSIANQLNKGGEFEDVLEATAPMLLEDLIEDGGFEQVRPQGQSRIGQGGPL